MQHVSPGKQRNRMVCKSPVARTVEPNADFTMMILGNASVIKRLLRIDGRPEPHPPTNMRVAGSLQIQLGRAQDRNRVGKHEQITRVAGYLTKKQHTKKTT